MSGLLTLYRTSDKVFAELPSSMLGKEFFVLISIAKGIGERDLLGGMTWGDGDDWIWEFRKVDDKIQVVRRNDHGASGGTVGLPGRDQVVQREHLRHRRTPARLRSPAPAPAPRAPASRAG